VSEFHVHVVRIGPVEKHPNADRLSITNVHGGYPVAFASDQFREGDLAVYVPVDAVVPEGDPRWEFLKGHRRIKAKKLRGVFSMGLLTPAEPGWVEGQDVRESLRVEKYEPDLHAAGLRLGVGGEAEPDHGYLPAFTDLEGFRKYGSVIREGEPVVITEKIHGANARFVFEGGRLWCGSRNQIKKDDPKSIWWRVARAYGLEAKLAQTPGLAIYGEVYGAVQDLRYGVESDVAFVMFDAADNKTGRYYDSDTVRSLARRFDLPFVPVLYEGPWNDACLDLRNGPSLIPGANHIREGFVVRPQVERFDGRIGRVILKFVGEEYLLRGAA
jgi:RNA ligase (TIGR02306 family)